MGKTCPNLRGGPSRFSALAARASGVGRGDSGPPRRFWATRRAKHGTARRGLQTDKKGKGFWGQILQGAPNKHERPI
eukprot:7396424-Pyramimonas_sp.AAC.1